MGKAFDTYQTNNLLSVAGAFQQDGYDAVFVYLFRTSQFKQKVTHEAAKTLCGRGFFLATVWENGTPTHAGYFGPHIGASDGFLAVTDAVQLGQPKGTPIYFAVDYDAAQGDLAAIKAYFTQVRARVLAAGYKVGVYGSGLVCRALTEAGLVEYTWLTQSRGFQGYSDWLPSANVVQGPEQTIHGIDLDLDTTDGAAGGWQI